MATAIAAKEPDFIYPIRAKGRAEYVLACFDQVIRSDTEAMLYYLINTGYQKYIDKLPGIQKLKNASREQIFDIAISLSPTELLFFLSSKENEDTLDYDELNDQIHSEYSSNFSSRLRTDIALYHLISEEVIKKLYIVDPYMDDEKLQIISSVFKEFCNEKVFAIKGTVSSAITIINEQLTTIFDVDVEEISSICKKMPSKIKDVYFLCSSARFSNYTSLPATTGGAAPEVKHKEDFQKYIEDKLCIVDYFDPLIYD